MNSQFSETWILGYGNVGKRTYVFFGGMGSELSGEDIQDPLPDPPALGEGGEGEVVRVNFAEIWKGGVGQHVMIKIGQPVNFKKATI